MLAASRLFPQKPPVFAAHRTVSDVLKGEITCFNANRTLLERKSAQKFSFNGDICSLANRLLIKSGRPRGSTDTYANSVSIFQPKLQ